jgi:DNA repair exonuclease SbcCD ATPase subunit
MPEMPPTLEELVAKHRLGELQEMKVQSTRAIGRDLNHNAKWIAAVLLAALVWCIVSSGFISWFEPEMLRAAAAKAVLGPESKSAAPGEPGFWALAFQAFYFTVINMTTVGFGDLAPVSFWGKVFAMLNAIVGLALFGVLVGLIVMAFQPGTADTDTGHTRLIVEHHVAPGAAGIDEPTAKEREFHDEIERLRRRIEEIELAKEQLARDNVKLKLQAEQPLLHDAASLKGIAPCIRAALENCESLKVTDEGSRCPGKCDGECSVITPRVRKRP